MSQILIVVSSDPENSQFVFSLSVPSSYVTYVSMQRTQLVWPSYCLTSPVSKLNDLMIGSIPETKRRFSWMWMHLMGYLAPMKVLSTSPDSSMIARIYLSQLLVKIICFSR